MSKCYRVCHDTDGNGVQIIFNDEGEWSTVMKEQSDDSVHNSMRATHSLEQLNITDRTIIEMFLRCENKILYKLINEYEIKEIK